MLEDTRQIRDGAFGVGVRRWHVGFAIRLRRVRTWYRAAPLQVRGDAGGQPGLAWPSRQTETTGHAGMFFHRPRVKSGMSSGALRWALLRSVSAHRQDMVAAS